MAEDRQDQARPELPPVLGGARVWTFARLVCNAGVQVGVTVSSALIVRRIFDGWIGPASPWRDPELAGLGAGLAALALLTGLARALERLDSERLGQDYVHGVRLVLFDQLSAMPPREIGSQSRGAILMRFVNDLSALRLWVSLGLSRLWAASILCLGTLSVLAFLNLPLAAAVGAPLAAGAGLALLLGPRMERAIREARRRRTRLASNVAEKIISMATVQVHGQTQRERRRIERQGQHLARAMVRRAGVTGSLRGLADGATALAICGALLVGAQQVAAGRATPGVVVAALAIVAILLPQVRALGRVWEYWQAARVSREKLRRFLTLSCVVAESRNATALEEGPGRLVFDDISLAGSVTGVRVSAEPGQRVAVVGRNGAGKSSLLALAARLIDPDHGRVTLDGQDLRKVTLSSLRQAIGLISSDVPLVRGSLTRNLRYRAPRASRRALARAVRRCGVDQVAAELPDGFDTLLTEGGGNLSMGQRQRVLLARGMLGGPRILLLDEADANLDPPARKAFDRALAEFEGTVLIVTHQLQRLREADVVWHLDGGLLVEAGAPDVLLERGGPTARLFRRALRAQRREGSSLAQRRDGEDAASSRARRRRRKSATTDSIPARNPAETSPRTAR